MCFALLRPLLRRCWETVARSWKKVLNCHQRREAKYRPAVVALFLAQKSDFSTCHFGWQAFELKMSHLPSCQSKQRWIKRCLDLIYYNIFFFQLYLESSIWKLLRGWYHLCVDWQVCSLTLSLIFVCLFVCFCLFWTLRCKQRVY